MNQIFSFLSKEVVEATGWTIFHSVWQAAFISILLGIILLLFRKFSSKTRYLISIVSLMFILVVSGITFVRSYRKACEKAEYSKIIRANPQLVVENFKNAIQNRETNTSKKLVTPELKVKWVVFKSYFQKQFPLIITIWILGILLLMMRLAGGLVYTNKLKYKNVAVFPSDMEKIVFNFVQQFKIKRKIKILQSLSSKIPMTLGYFKPIILIPASLLTGLPADQIEIIIAHELAHIARHDYLFNMVQSVIEILFFYHPAVWWISSRVRSERENCCDDVAVELTGDSVAFAKALTNVQEHLLYSEQGFALAFSGNKNKLFNRIKRILTKPVMRKNLNEKLIVSCVIFAGFMILAVSAAFSAGNEGTPVQKDMMEYVLTPEDTAKFNNLEEILIENETGNNGTGKNSYNGSGNDSDAKTNTNTEKEIEEVYSHLETLGVKQESLLNDLEIMLEDLEDPVNREILEGLRVALQEIDINTIVNEAMNGAEAALNEMDLNVIVEESMKKEEEKQDIDKISREAIKGARAALDNMDINLIVEEALNGVEEALDQMDLQLDEVDFDSDELDDTMDKIEEEMDDAIDNSDFDEDDERIERGEIHGNSNADKYTSIMKDGAEVWNKWRTENDRVVPDLSDVYIRETNLQKVNLSDLSLTGAEFEKSDFRGADFKGCNATGFYLGETTADEANFQQATLIEASFEMCSLVNADFRNANLNGTEFINCTLTETDFRNANIRDVNFEGGVLKNCNFKGAVANHSTRFPDGFDWEKEGVRME